jgi:integrase
VKVLQRRIGETLIHLARWTDPRSGRARELSLSSLGLSTEEARRDWAIRKSRSLDSERAALKAGDAPTVPDVGLRAAVDDYLARSAEHLRPLTVRGYKHSLERFATWAAKAGISVINELRPEHLSGFKASLLRARKQRVIRSGRRGEHGPSDKQYSAVSLNTYFRALKVFLNAERRLGRTPRVDRDAISDRLRSERTERPRPRFLRPPQVRKLLEAALRHDRATFRLTRAEKDGNLPVGSTPRFPPVAPFVLTCLLGGFRLSEALVLRWQNFDAEAGEIILPASAVKTKQERSVDLRVSPSLTLLFTALRLRSTGPYILGGKEPLSADFAKAARERLVQTFEAPAFGWQDLRRTCSTVLCNAQGIYQAAAPFLAAKRCGHSVVISEKHYAGLLRDLPREARTIEAALGIEDLAAEIVREAQGIVEGVAHAHG